jgi:hypothetical protein
MNRKAKYAARLGALVLATVVVLAGCKTASPVTQPPTATSTPTPAATPTATPSSTAAPSAVEIPTAVPEATATAAPSATAAASAAPSSVAGLCSGTADQQAFFAAAAAKLPMDVYCAVIPAGWWLASANYQQPNGGLLVAGYKNNAGATVEISEGNFCTTTPSTCWAVVTTIGTGKFGPLSGTLVTASATPVYGIYVGANTTHSYVITGQGMTQAKFVAIAAAIVKVPKA